MVSRLASTRKAHAHERLGPLVLLRMQVGQLSLFSFCCARMSTLFRSTTALAAHYSPPSSLVRPPACLSTVLWPARLSLP